MTRQGSTRGAVLLKAVGAAGLIGLARIVSGGLAAGRHPAEPEGGSSAQANDGLHSRRRDLVTYGIGYGLALLLTCAAFAVVTWRWAAGATALGVVFGLALVQAVVHFRCFLHIDFKRSARDDLQLIVFSTLIIALMVGGTIVVLVNLRMRMM